MVLDQLLDDSIRVFGDAYRLSSGLYLDKLTTVANTKSDPRASTSAAGFGLIALCVGAERGIYTTAEAIKYARATIESLVALPRSANGFIIHWSQADDGSAIEFSTIDTAICVLSAIMASDYLVKHAPPADAAAAEALASRVTDLAGRTTWTDALLDEHEGSPGMWRESARASLDLRTSALCPACD